MKTERSSFIPEEASYWWEDENKSKIHQARNMESEVQIRSDEQTNKIPSPSNNQKTFSICS